MKVGTQVEDIIKLNQLNQLYYYVFSFCQGKLHILDWRRKIEEIRQVKFLINSS